MQNRSQADTVDLVSKSDSEDSEDMSESEQEEASWVTWFCGLRGNEFFCEVDEEYIEDDFNLSGLSSQAPYYEYALDLILDNELPQDVMLTDQQHEMLESAAEMLYGLIHARFIVTARGLSAMLEKYKNVDFGRCPRLYCEGQACLPVGTSDLPGQNTVKVFCPKCEDIYYPRIDNQCSIDGAFFGTTFPHLLLMTYPMYRPPKPTALYVPRVFGFKLHRSAYAGRPGGAAGSADGQEGNRQLVPGAVSTGRAAAAAAVAAATNAAGGAGRGPGRGGSLVLLEGEAAEEQHDGENQQQQRQAASEVQAMQASFSPGNG